MKLIKQARLFFQQGSSDKVYEVDLCEVGKDEFVVNFRYGRRGSNLKEGTKTVFPVSEGEAEKIYASLVGSKQEKGYLEQGQAAPKQTAFKPEDDLESNPKTEQEIEFRKLAILNHLKNAAQGRHNEKKWKLSRVIWKAGELALREAETDILKLIKADDPMLTYSCIWALGRCGSSVAIPFLETLKVDQRQPKHNVRIIWEALFSLETDENKGVMANKFLDKLPNLLKTLIIEEKEEDLEKVLRDLHDNLQSSSNQHLYDLYIVSITRPLVKRVLLKFLKTMPLKPNYFKYFRMIFKAAEFRGDIETYSLCSYRLEKEVEFFTKPNYWNQVYLDSQWVKISEEMPKENSRLAYSDKTRAYLKRRVVRNLKNLGALKIKAYAYLAGETLLKFRDDVDKTEPYKVSLYSYDYQTYQSNSIDIHYDSFSAYSSFYYILYANSPRYELNPLTRNWKCTGEYTPGKPAPLSREEAFPEIWDQAPEVLKHLMKESLCFRVQEFAIRAFRANPSFKSEISLELVVDLFSKPYEICHSFALELAKELYDPTEINEELMMLMVSSSLSEARALGLQWVGAQKQNYFQSVSLCSVLITSTFEDVLEWSKHELMKNQFEVDKANLIIAKVISIYLSKQEVPNAIHVSSDLFCEIFSGPLSKINLHIIQDFFTHPLHDIQAIGGKILINHSLPAEEIPSEFLSLLLEATSIESRKIGMALFKKLSTESLLERKALLFNFCLSELADIRQEVRPIISQLAKSHKEFAIEAVQMFTPALLRKENYEGVHDDLSKLLSQELSDYLDQIEERIIWGLIDSKYKGANDLGAHLLFNLVKPETLSMQKLTSLASHEVQSIRSFVWNFFRDNLDTIRDQKFYAIKILDSTWDDTRAFAFEYFKSQFTKEEWTPELLVSVCDSTRDDVQTYGRNLINQYFEEKDGPDYLLQLAQHPSSNLQLFASNYLARYSAGNMEVLKKLEHFFLTVLSQVNKGRVTKRRVIEFLRQEAIKDADIAKLVVDIFNRQVITIAILDKARVIEALVQIQHKYPELECKVNIQKAPSYSEVQG